MFVDEKIVLLKAGNGGDGCASFRREKYIPKGGPNGGDGGKGGDIILECDTNISDLTQYHFKSHWNAKNGESGKSNQKHGSNGENCLLKLPAGTIIYDLETGAVVAELTENKQKIVLIEGGKGGLGNIHFKSSTNRAPREFTPGEKIEAREFKFVLKTIADIGLVGYPNAGKSSLTNLITKAQPKTGAYPFTTKSPIIGIIEYPDLYKRLKLADIPGLIEGASENRGLGHRFLRHIERCRILLIIIDMAGYDGRDPLKDYESLKNELNLYDPKLLEKNIIVAANKMDLPEAKDNLKRFKKKYKTKILPISCLNEEGIDDLKSYLLECFENLNSNLKI